MVIQNDKLVLGTYEINTQFRSYRDYTKYVDPTIEWIDTAITYNNDYFLRDEFDRKIISKISPYMTENYEFWVRSHMQCLGRKFIDIMLVHNTRHKSWLKLYGMILKDPRFASVGISNANISQLEQIKDKYGKYPEWVETEINPRYYDSDLIEFCKSNGIKIIAYAIFGGKYNARRFIQEFTMPYLLDLVDRSADKIIIRWDDEYQYNQIMRNLAIKVNDDKFVKLNKLELSKSITPDVYNLPFFVPIDICGFPIYANESIPVNIIENRFTGDMLDEYYRIPDIGLEFITEYQAYRRYQNRSTRVAIIDRSGRLTKVFTKGCKIYATSIS